MSTHHSGSGLNTMDFAGQVLPPPGVDFATQALTSISTTPSPAGMLSATVKKEWDFTGQVLPHEQPNLVRKTESLSVGSRTQTEIVPERADVTRRNAELVAYISLHCTYCTCCVHAFHRQMPCSNVHGILYILYRRLHGTSIVWGKQL